MYRYPKLLTGKFIKRYKRFFTDVDTDMGVITAHNPNTGSMTGMLEEGREVLLSLADNPDRKLKYTVEGFLVNGRWALTNTILMNRIVKHGILDGEIEELNGTSFLKPEYVYGEGRIDFYGEIGKRRYLAEVKNTTMYDDRYAIFPDAVTERGRKHLRVLMKAKEEGYEPYMIYVCQIDRPFFRPAYEVDTTYAAALEAAVANGLNVITVLTDFDIETETVRLVKGGELRLRR